MEQSTSNRRFLSSLAGTKYVTDSALSAILQKLSQADVDVNELSTSRWSISRAVQADVSTPTAHGPLLSKVNLPMNDGSNFEWTVVDPAALLCWLCHMSPSFEKAFAGAHESKPSHRGQPWSIIVYLDEATPRNMLDQDVTRKSWCFYWQFEELGAELLSKDEVWLVGGIIRTETVKDVLGGVSAVFKHSLTYFRNGHLFLLISGSLMGTCFFWGNPPFLGTCFF